MLEVTPCGMPFIGDGEQVVGQVGGGAAQGGPQTGRPTLPTLPPAQLATPSALQVNGPQAAPFAPLAASRSEADDGRGGGESSQRFALPAYLLVGGGVILVLLLVIIEVRLRSLASQQRHLDFRLDALAKSGVRYTHAFTTAGVCAPCRSGIITG